MSDSICSYNFHYLLCCCFLRYLPLDLAILFSSRTKLPITAPSTFIKCHFHCEGASSRYLWKWLSQLQASKDFFLPLSCQYPVPVSMYLDVLLSISFIWVSCFQVSLLVYLHVVPNSSTLFQIFVEVRFQRQQLFIAFSCIIQDGIISRTTFVSYKKSLD